MSDTFPPSSFSSDRRQEGLQERDRQHGWWLLALALGIATAFVWFAWQSNERQAMLERTLSRLAADTGQLADDLDDSSKARAELLETVRSLKRSESQTADTTGIAENETDIVNRLQNELETLRTELASAQQALQLSEAVRTEQAETHAAERSRNAADCRSGHESEAISVF